MFGGRSANKVVILHRRLLAIVRDDAVCRRLMTTPGVGPVVALTYRATVDVPARFRKSKSVGAVFGLTCTKYQSGEIDRRLAHAQQGGPQPTFAFTTGQMVPNYDELMQRPVELEVLAVHAFGKPLSPWSRQGPGRGTSDRGRVFIWLITRQISPVFVTTIGRHKNPRACGASDGGRSLRGVPRVTRTSQNVLR